VHTVNELELDAPIENAWAWLVRASEWPSWYPHARHVVIDPPAAGDLAEGASFHWTTFGVRMHTTVTEFEPPARLAWEGRGLGAVGYHGWLLEPTPRGCHLVTEEVQKGLVPSLARWLFRWRIHYQHDRWLAGLAAVAKTGPPPRTLSPPPPEAPRG